MAVHGDTLEDFAQVKAKNAALALGARNPYARYRKAVTAEEVAASTVVAHPLRLLDICATSDGGAALVLAGMDFARRHGAGDAVRIRAVSTVTPRFPNTVLDLTDIATDSAVAVPPTGARVVPEGEAVRLLREGATAPGGRMPVNTSGGLASFGEAVPAQAIAQVCELTWPLRGVTGDRQVPGVCVGLSANQGLFGLGSVVAVR